MEMKFRKSASAFLFAILLIGIAPSPAVEAVPDNPGKTDRYAYSAALTGTLLPIGLGSFLLYTQSDGMAGVGGVLLAGGLLVGPSTGQFYAGSIGHGLLGTGIRTLGVALILGGAVNNTTSLSCLEREAGQEPCESKGGSALSLLGGATLLGGTIYSLAETHFAVARHHQRRERHAAFGLAPTLAREAGGGVRPGAMAQLRF